MKTGKAFWATQLITFGSVLFYVLLFRHVGNIINAVFYTDSDYGALETLTEEKAESIKEEVAVTLNEKSIQRSLYRYFVFFYLDEFTKRQVFISESGVPLSRPVQETDGDPFYISMLTYHLNGVCFLQNTTDISKNSIVHQNFSKTNEIDPNIFYLSCPIFLNDTLVGYIGGLNNKEDGSISVETAAVRSAAKSVQNILEGNDNGTERY